MRSPLALACVLPLAHSIAMMPPVATTRPPIVICGVGAEPLLRNRQPVYHPTPDARGWGGVKMWKSSWSERAPRWSDMSASEVTFLGAAINVLLAGLKAVAGMWTGSASLVADAGHSLSDLISDAIALAASARPELEAVCTQGIALMLVLCGGGMIYSSVGAISAVRASAAVAAGEAVASATLNAVGLSVALLSIGLKEALYHATRAVGLRCGSTTLVANALHHRSDAMSSVAAAIGLFASLRGFHMVDPLAAVVIGGMVLKLGIETSREGGHAHAHAH